MFYKVEQGDKLLLIKWKKKKQNKLKKKKYQLPTPVQA